MTAVKLAARRLNVVHYINFMWPVSSYHANVYLQEFISVQVKSSSQIQSHD